MNKIDLKECKEQNSIIFKVICLRLLCAMYMIRCAVVSRVILLLLVISNLVHTTHAQPYKQHRISRSGSKQLFHILMKNVTTTLYVQRVI